MFDMLRRVSFGAVALLAGIVSAPVASAQSLETELSSAVTSWMTEYGIRSAAITIGRQDDVIWKRGFGGWSPDQPRLIASLSKAITAVCISTLLDKDRIALETTVGQVMRRWFHRFGEPADPRVKTATIAQLMAHRGGYDRQSDGATGGSLLAHLRAYSASEPRIDELLQRALRVRLAAAPGSRYSYSNVHYLLLGAIIEQATGAPYEEYCGDQVLRRMGVVDGGLHPRLRVLSAFGGWQLSGPQYLGFMKAFDDANPILGVASRIVMTHGDDRWTSPDSNVFYGLGMRVRLHADGGSEFWHGGAWRQSSHNVRDGVIRESIGSYVARLENGVTWFASFSPSPVSGRAYRSLERQINEVLRAVPPRP